MSALGILVILVLAAAVLVALAAWFYERSTREVSLIRTGLGGRKVVMDGGTIALPWFNDIARVNMQTLRLEVRRSGDQALITKDRLRVDVGVEFYVSVEPTEEAISRASQTLGERTFNPDKLRELIEGKLVDTLRAMAAQMTMDELHENRAGFARDVRENLAETLARNGLVLESVSLTALDQTPFAALDENNAFNAVGMRKLAEVIATARKQRAEIESDAEVSVHRAAMEASKRRLEIDLEEQEAQIAQVQQLESLRARQLSEVAQRKAESEEAATGARIAMERAIRTADLAREKSIREVEIAQQQALEIADQQRVIAVAKITEGESKARAAADLAKADAVRAAEAIATARATAEAERKRDLHLIAARQEGEANGLRLKMRAKSEAEAAIDTAAAQVETAKAEAASEEFRIAAMEKEMAARAKGRKALNEAENVFTKEALAHKGDVARLEALPGIVREMVKPAKKIDSIKIHHITGGALDRSGGGAAGDKPVVNQAIDSVLDMAVQLPALKRIGEELGLSLEDGVAGMTEKPKKKD
jgi:uncharacterized membrane protein YqiK